MSNILCQNRKSAEKGKYFYGECFEKTGDVFDGTKERVVFYLSEKMLLPRLFRQPGWYKFTAGLNLDLFGMCYSNKNETMIYEQCEGHFPHEKNG